MVVDSTDDPRFAQTGEVIDSETVARNDDVGLPIGHGHLGPPLDAASPCRSAGAYTPVSGRVFSSPVLSPSFSAGTPALSRTVSRRLVIGVSSG